MRNVRASTHFADTLVRLWPGWRRGIHTLVEHNLGGDVSELCELEQHAAETIRRKIKQAQKLKHASWRQWVSVQMKKGAGALHSYVKRVEQLPAQSSEVPKASLQEVVDGDREKLLPVLDKYVGRCAAPWREADAVDGEEVLPPITLGDMVRASRPFREHTAVGTDCAPPQWFGWISSELLFSFIGMLHAIEGMGWWPDQIAYV